MGVRRRSVLAAARAELRAADVVDSALGAAALTLAERLDAGEERGSGLAAISKELRCLLSAACEDVGKVGDPVDELRQRREARLRGA